MLDEAAAKAVVARVIDGFSELVVERPWGVGDAASAVADLYAALPAFDAVLKRAGADAGRDIAAGIAESVHVAFDNLSLGFAPLGRRFQLPGRPAGSVAAEFLIALGGYHAVCDAVVPCAHVVCVAARLPPLALDTARARFVGDAGAVAAARARAGEAPVLPDEAPSDVYAESGAAGPGERRASLAGAPWSTQNLAPIATWSLGDVEAACRVARAFWSACGASRAAAAATALYARMLLVRTAALAAQGGPPALFGARAHVERVARGPPGLVSMRFESAREFAARLLGMLAAARIAATGCVSVVAREQIEAVPLTRDFLVAAACAVPAEVARARAHVPALREALLAVAVRYRNMQAFRENVSRASMRLTLWHGDGDVYTTAAGVESRMIPDHVYDIAVPPLALMAACMVKLDVDHVLAMRRLAPEAPDYYRAWGRALRLYTDCAWLCCANSLLFEAIEKAASSAGGGVDVSVLRDGVLSETELVDNTHMLVAATPRSGPRIVYLGEHWHVGACGRYERCDSVVHAVAAWARLVHGVYNRTIGNVTVHDAILALAPEAGAAAHGARAGDALEALGITWETYAPPPGDV